MPTIQFQYRTNAVGNAHGKALRHRKPSFAISVSHDPADASGDALALWYQSLSMARRIAILNDLTAMIVEANDGLPEKHDAAPLSGRVQILSIPQSEIRRYWRDRLGKSADGG